MAWKRISRWQWFWETVLTLKLAHIFRNSVIWCPLLSQLYPSSATALFLVGQRANPDIHSSYVESVRRNTNLDAGVVRYYIFYFSCPFYKFEAAPLHFFGVQDENLFLSKRDCRRMEAQGCEHCTGVPSTAAPSSCQSPCSILPVGLQICTRKEFLRKSLHMHHLAIFCTDCVGIRAPFRTKRTWEWRSVHTC